MLGTTLRPMRAGSHLLSHVRSANHLRPLCIPLLHRASSASWKAAATAPSSSSSSSKSGSDGRNNRFNRRDAENSGQRQQKWGRRDGSSSSSSSRDSGHSRARPQQQQQQRRDWQESAVRDDEGTWDEYETNDSYDNNRNDSFYDRADDGDYKYPTRPSKASYRDELFGDALYGVAPVLAALKAGVRTPHVLLMQEGLTAAQRKDARALQEIQKLVADTGAAVKTVSKHQLNMLAGNRPHQGLILDASPLQWESLEVFPAADELQQQQQQQGDEAAAAAAAAAGVRHPVWLALDEVMDPQNLGAMIRSAYCLGVSGILACKRNCCPLSPVVSKASAGAVELMTLHSCRSMPRTLTDAASKGWAIVGAAAESGAIPLSQFTVVRPTILVMGNEGYGLRTLVKRCCTELVQIEMASAAAVVGGGREQLVDSLNVSVATGILLHQLMTTASK